MTTHSQNQTVLRHLMLNRSITPYVAFVKYGIMRLSARVYDLKGQGCAIKTDIKHTETAMGEKRYAVYSLIKGGK